MQFTVAAATKNRRELRNVSLREKVSSLTRRRLQDVQIVVPGTMHHGPVTTGNVTCIAATLHRDLSENLVTTAQKWLSV
eukprot:symbB.v1.2.013547.t1/scaffold952.1/size217748/5